GAPDLRTSTVSTCVQSEPASSRILSQRGAEAGSGRQRSTGFDFRRGVARGEVVAQAARERAHCVTGGVVGAGRSRRRPAPLPGGGGGGRGRSEAGDGGGRRIGTK